MADEVIKKVGVVLETKTEVDTKSAKKAGRDGAKAVKDGFEEVTKKGLGSIEKQIENIASKSKAVFTEIEHYAKKVSSADVLKNINANYKKQLDNARAEALNSHASKQKMYEQLWKELDFSNSAKEVQEAMGAITPQAPQKTWNDSFGFLNESIDNVTDGMGRLKEAMSPVSTLAGGLFKEMGRGFKNVAKRASDAVKPVTIFFNQIKRIALYRAIRSALKKITQGFQEGIQNAYQWAVVTGNQFAKSMDMMATSALYLKNSLGAMTMPLINTLAPILDVITDRFVDLINIINQFIASLTGASTWTRALKYPKEYAEAVSGAGKEIKNQLLGFDELNILNAPSGGSGGSALDYGAMFQEMELSAKDLNFAKAIKEAIKNSKWSEVGHLLAVRFNGMVEKIQSVDLANALGEKLNSAISLIHTLLNEADIYQVGVKIGQFISNLKLDWAKISASWIRWKTYIFDALIGLIEGVNWANVGHSIGEFVKGLFNGIANWLKEVDWYKLASNITQAFFDLIGSIDWNGILRGLYSALAGVLSAVWNSISGAFRTLIQLFTGELSLSDIINRVHHTGASIYEGVHISVGGNTHVGGGGRGFAEGGYPEQGSYFYAGERGPELVAQIGGRTGVMNTDQMAQSLATANEGMVSTMVEVGNAIISAINRKDTSININDVRKAIHSTGLRYGV